MKAIMNGIFAIEKPSGMSSSKLVAELQHIFTNSKIFHDDLTEMRNKARMNLATDKSWTNERIKKRVSKIKIKIGHGGTLDPLASGVLVIGVGSGTKKLLYYLGECRKVYETRALLGISTTTGDSEGEILTKNETSHITSDIVKEAAERFVGDIKQTPPIFSALKMNGKPLYDYAREGKPLPYAIKTRDVQVPAIKVHEEDTLSTDHHFETLESQLDENGQPKENALFNNPTLNDSPLYFSSQFMEKCAAEGKTTEVGKPRTITTPVTGKLPLMHLTCDVSSGTYIRSLISDIGRAMESSAYMVELIRVKQSEWELGKNCFKFEDFFKNEEVWGPVLKNVLLNGCEINIAKEMEVCEEKYKQTEQARQEEEDHVHNEEGNTLEEEKGIKRPISEVE